MDASTHTQEFQPSLLGMRVLFQDEGPGMITDENETDIFIESGFFTGWMPKPEFFDLFGIED